MIDPKTFDLLTLCALRVGKKSVDWSLLAREIVVPDNVDMLLEGVMLEGSAVAHKNLPVLREALAGIDDARARVETELAAAEKAGAWLVTVLDDEYPLNLRFVHDRPPFLFGLGERCQVVDIASVAVVGTRQATEPGREAAARLATQLAGDGVTVVSGLARGIDTAAHTAALDANGRTLSVIGTGICRTYPPENAGLAKRIAESGGSILSQFWPTSGPAQWTFPRRNRVMSGITQGTVVVEASSTSGAKMQARLALEHGRWVFLVSKLVDSQKWAEDYVKNRGARTITKVEDVTRLVATPDRILDLWESRQDLEFGAIDGPEEQLTLPVDA
jgi:DNA processing protein